MVEMLDSVMIEVSQESYKLIEDRAIGPLIDTSEIIDGKLHIPISIEVYMWLMNQSFDGEEPDDVIRRLLGSAN